MRINFENESEYKQAKEMLDANNAAVKKYLSDNKTNCIPSEIAKTFPFADKINNDIRSAIETYEFINDIPQSYFLYISEKDNNATTWTGQVLGYVQFGNLYRSNFGDKRIPVRIKAINGKRYYGTYYKDAGDYALIKLCKNQ